MNNRTFGVLIHGAGWVSGQHIAAFARNPTTRVLAGPTRAGSNGGPKPVGGDESQSPLQFCLELRLHTGRRNSLRESESTSDCASPPMKIRPTPIVIRPAQPVSYSLRVGALLGLILAVVSGCGQRQEHTEDESKPGATEQASLPTSSPIPQQEDSTGAKTAASAVAQAPALSATTSELESLKAQAEAGDSKAETALGNYYTTGQGGRIDIPEAIKWYRAAADRGQPQAQYNLGVIYSRGLVVPRNDQEALKWFSQSAQQGDAMAQYELGAMYAGGLGVAASPDEANQWFQKAAAQGDGMAQLQLAMAKAKESNTPLTPEQLAAFYRGAAEQGYAEAQIAIGSMYAKGQGVERDPAEALKW